MKRQALKSVFLLAFLFLFQFPGKAGIGFNSLPGQKTEGSSIVSGHEDLKSPVFDHIDKMGVNSHLSELCFNADEDDSCCPKNTYVMMYRSVVSCSNGTYNDTGFQPIGTIETCGEEPAPEPSTNCKYWTEPGPSLGDGDVTCSLCQYVSYYLDDTDSSDCCSCDASDLTFTYKVELPSSVKSLTDALAGLAENAPMIEKIKVKIDGECALTKGEECCQEDPCDPPVGYGEWKCSASCGISVELNIPGWSWEVKHTWKGIYFIHGLIKLGPTVTLSPSAQATLTGREYYGDCLGCMQVTANIGIGVEVKFRGEIKLEVIVECWPHKSFEVSGEAGLSASTSISCSGYHKYGGCEGQKVCVSVGALEGKAYFSVEILGFSVNWEQTVTILPGWEACQ